MCESFAEQQGSGQSAEDEHLGGGIPGFLWDLSEICLAPAYLYM